MLHGAAMLLERGVPGGGELDVHSAAVSLVGSPGGQAGLLNALGAGTLGWSGGGPHALACDALLTGRCRAAVTIACTALYGSPGLDWLAGMGPENVEGFTIALAGDRQHTELLTADAGSLRTVTGEQVITAFGGVIDEADKAVLTGEFAGYMADSLRAGVRNGIAGWHDDELALVGEWGFALDDPSLSPVAIWQGDQDRIVPCAHGEWLARNVAGARADLMPGEGHLSLIATKIGDILDDLTDMPGL